MSRVPDTPFPMVMPKDFKGQKFFRMIYKDNDFKDENEDFDKLNELLHDYAEGDCWALIVDDEEIWNSYNKTSIKKQFMDDMARSYFIDNKHRITTLIRVKGKGNIALYMFGPHAYRMQCDYSKEDGGFNVSFWCSSEYLDKYKN